MTQKQQLDPSLYAFLDSCIWDKGIRNIDQDTKEQMIMQLAERLQQWLLQTALSHLQDTDIEHFNTLVESGTNETEMQHFLRRRIANFEEVYTHSLIDFKKTYVGN